MVATNTFRLLSQEVVTITRQWTLIGPGMTLQQYFAPELPEVVGEWRDVPTVEGGPKMIDQVTPEAEP